MDSEAELAAARALVKRKSAAMADLGDQVRHRRLAGLLSRRGFGPAVMPGAGRATGRMSLTDAMTGHSLQAQGSSNAVVI